MRLFRRGPDVGDIRPSMFDVETGFIDDGDVSQVVESFSVEVRIFRHRPGGHPSVRQVLEARHHRRTREDALDAAITTLTNVQDKS